MCLMANHASYLSGLDSMIDFLRVKKRAGSGRIHMEHGTWWGKRHLSSQPNQLSQLAHLWGRADRSTSQRVCSFMLPFLCTWCYLCLDPTTPSASLSCCQTPLSFKTSCHLLFKNYVMPLLLTPNSHYHPCHRIIIFTCLCLL